MATTWPADCKTPCGGWVVVTVWMLAWMLIAPLPIDAQDASSDRLARFTRAPTRVVWVQDTSRGAQDVQAQGTELVLMGYDSLDGRGERKLLPDPANYARPLLSPDGRRIIYTDRPRGRVMVLDWGSNRPQVLTRGAALCTWRDPSEKTEWVVVGQRLGRAGSYFYRNLTRVRLDEPSVSRPVWSRTRVSPDNFQLSRDGDFAAGVFPWPNGGLARLAPPSLTHLGKGCWASLAPDNSRLAWVFDGPHRHLRLSTPADGPKWKVAVDQIVGSGSIKTRAATAGRGAEMFHPRWSNHVRYLVLTGPYNRKGPINVISGGGPQVEVYLARFSEDFRQIEAAARVSQNTRPDFFPDAWIGSGSTSRVPANVMSPARPTASGQQAWPPKTANLLWAFHDTRKPLTIPAGDTPGGTTCRIKPAGRVRPGRFFELRLSRGTAATEPGDTGLVEHWNTRQTLSVSMMLTLTATRSNRPGTLLAIEPASITRSSDTPKRLALIVNHRPAEDDFQLVLVTGPDPATGSAVLATLKPDTATHLVITLGKLGVSVRKDGRPAQEHPLPLGRLKLPPRSRLWLGNDSSTRQPVEGRISLVTVSGSIVSDNQAVSLWNAASVILKKRKPGRRAVVRARCVETSPAPTPTQIAPYRRALVYHHYRIDRVESGRLPHREILVGHWAILDGKAQPGRRRTIGRPVRLVVEPLEDHAQLDSERQVMEIEHVELPQYVDVE